MRKKQGSQIDDLRIGKMMEEFGFNPESSTSTARALILNLVRSAYGPDAAREFMRQMNLEKNRNVESADVIVEFEKNQLETRVLNANSDSVSNSIPGVGTLETQLSLFDFTTDQKKSRRA